MSLGFCVEDDRGLVEREEKGTERAYIDDYGLVSQYLTPVYPNTLHQDLPPAFGTLDFAPSPAIVPVRLSSTNSLPILPILPRPFFFSLQQLLLLLCFSFCRIQRVEDIFRLLHRHIHRFCRRATYTQDAVLAIDEHDRKDGALDDVFV